jgi:glucose-1-phosphate cytidylyltransferase
MLEVSGRPVVEHVMRHYQRFGHRDFILSVGFKKEVICDYFASYEDGCAVRCVDTGIESDTGERIALLKPLLGETFFATYADGLGDVDVTALLEFHRSHGAAATVTMVPLRSQYGTLSVDPDGRVVAFNEKPIIWDVWINGGFFVFEPKALEMWQGRNLEREVLPALASRGELFAYRHAGAWKSMDTFKDQQEMNQWWPTVEQRMLESLQLAG